MDQKTRKEAINNLVDLTKNTEQFILIYFHNVPIPRNKLITSYEG
jgi:hypothetical protein